MKIVRTNTFDKDFVELTHQLDAELTDRYGSNQLDYDEHNKIDPVNTVIIGYLDKQPVACGCFKKIDKQTIEIKRMYVHKANRKRGLSTEVLKNLEEWGAQLGFSKALLETGKNQPEAISLYNKCGYQIIKNYGPYDGVENSVCMSKTLV